jgi:hypothetical protein
MRDASRAGAARGRGRSRLLVAGIAAAAMLAAGCGDSGSGVGGRPSSGTTTGGGTSPECGAFGQACIGQGLDAPVALGGSIEVAVSYQVAGSSGPPTSLEAVDASVLLATDTDLEAVGPGCSAVLFVDPDGTVVDFIHVWVVAAEELRILRYNASGQLLGRVQDEAQLLVGDEILVAVEPYADAQPLLGNFALQRDVVGDAVAVVPDPVGGWYRVVARTPGTATVSFSGLGIEATWQIEVLP